MDALIALLSRTAWTMETPLPFGAFHLLFFSLGTLCALLAAFLLRRMPDRYACRTVFAVGCLFVLMELYKQLFYYCMLRDRTYDWWILPFQLCSIPMYLCLVLPFLNPGRARDTISDFLLSFGAMAGFAAFLQPEGMLHPYLALSLHSCIWHVLQMFIGFWIGFSGRAGKSIKSFGRSILLYVLLCCAAYGINVALWEISGHGINMFYIGPMETTTVVFRSLKDACGQPAASLAYMAASCLGALLFWLPFHLCRRKQKAPSNGA